MSKKSLIFHIPTLYTKLRYFKQLILLNMPFYAVVKGHQPGVYTTWTQCQNQINNFSGAKYKRFETAEQAEAFVKHNGNITFSDTFEEVESLPAEAVNPLEALVEHVNEIESNVVSVLGEIQKIKKILVDLTSQKCSVNSSIGVKRRSPIEECVIPMKRCDSKDGSSPMNFKYDSEGYVEVYTDGACENNGKFNAKAGLGVYFGEGHPLNTSEPCKGRATNNCGEIQAAIKAVKLVKDFGKKKLSIHTDSKFLINAMTQWLSAWKKRGWTLSDGNPVKNKIDFEELDKEIQGMNIKWKYVKAHSGIFGNEMADQLAREGAEKYGQSI